VRLYLSSFRLGNHPEQLLALLRDPGPAAVICNAMDWAQPEVRKSAVDRELAALVQLGLDPKELDLRKYFDNRPRLAADLAQYRLVWLRGGNVFVLRYTLARSGADELVAELLKQDQLVYAGYSAGCCVLAPSLGGLELVDDPGAVRQTYGADPVWDGLGLLDYAIVPHYRSDHPESEAVELIVARYNAEGVPHRALRDGEAIVVDTSRPSGLPSTSPAGSEPAPGPP
jgi:dipeptidase E